MTQYGGGIRGGRLEWDSKLVRKKYKEGDRVDI